jgi:hypothetical protein
VLQSDNESLNQERQRNARQQQQVDAVHEQDNQLRRCRQELAVCISDLSQTFLMVMMQWEDPVDADLIVTDPAGRQFTWLKNNRQKKEYPDTDAQLSFDISAGPGIEIWLSPSVDPGDYKVDYRLAQPYGRSVKVSGYYLDRTGRRPLPSKTLNDNDLCIHAATIHLGPDGKITLENASTPDQTRCSQR